MNTWDRLMISTPINRQAAIITARSRKTPDDGPLTIAELSELLTRLMRMHQLMKHVLRIKNASQHVNFLYKRKHGLDQYRTAGVEPRIVTAYVDVGVEIQRLITAIADIKRSPEYIKEKQLKQAMQDAWWNSLTPEEQAAHRQAVFNAKQEQR